MYQRLKATIYISNLCLDLCQNWQLEQLEYQLHAAILRPQKCIDLQYHRHCLGHN